MGAGVPNWSKVAHERLTRNQDLRRKLGLEPREEGLLDFAKIAASIHEENVKFEKQLAEGKVVVQTKKKKGRPKVSQEKVELDYSKEDEEVIDLTKEE